MSNKKIPMEKWAKKTPGHSHMIIKGLPHLKKRTK